MRRAVQIVTHDFHIRERSQIKVPSRFFGKQVPVRFDVVSDFQHAFVFQQGQQDFNRLFRRNLTGFGVDFFKKRRLRRARVVPQRNVIRDTVLERQGKSDKLCRQRRQQIRLRRKRDNARFHRFGDNGAQSVGRLNQSVIRFDFGGGKHRFLFVGNPMRDFRDQTFKAHIR